MPPLFMNVEVPEAGVSAEMLAYLKKTERKRVASKKLLGLLKAKGILLYTPLIKWYLNHGLVIDAVHATIAYKPSKIFEWFVEEITKARREGDECKEKVLLAEVMKLLGNSAYGKLIEAVERHLRVAYTSDKKVINKALRSAWFEDLEEIGDDSYEIKSRKPSVTINRPFQVGIAVYQLAKLRILEFYYDFLNRYINRCDFELFQMDTDSPLL